MGLRRHELLLEEQVDDGALVGLEEIQHEADMDYVHRFIESWFAARHLDVSVEFQVIEVGGFVAGQIVDAGNFGGRQLDVQRSLYDEFFNI